jgi:O-antigen ligase
VHLFPNWRWSHWIALIVTIFGALLAGWGVNFLPPYLFTVALGLAGFGLVIARPMIGLGLMLAVLYFPLFPTIPFGPVEFSASTLMVLGLFVAALIKLRGASSNPLARWQWGLLGALTIIFMLATFLGVNLKVSVTALPNLLLYVVILFSFMVLIDTPQKLWNLARLIIVLDFVLSIWRSELGPLRSLFSLPSLGINGAVYNFHPGVALIMVMMSFESLRKLVSPPWKWFSFAAFLSLVIHSMILQSRSAWLAWIIVAILIFLRVRGRERMVMLGLALAATITVGGLYLNVFSTNLDQTRTSLGGVLEGDVSSVNSSDLIRIRAQEAGWRMFLARPIFGWGPNEFNILKPAFVLDRNRLSLRAGAFNSWLSTLAEMGIVTVTVDAIAFLFPLMASWIYLSRKYDDAMAALAFAFSLGALAVGIHMFFIDLFFSFAWAQVGLALVAVRLVQLKASLVENANQ